MKTFNSTRQAEKSLGIYNITRACKGEFRQAGGYRWMYKSDYEK